MVKYTLIRISRHPHAHAHAGAQDTRNSFFFLRVRCSTRLVRDHLMFFMSEWLKERSSLEGFPFELLGHARRGGEDGALRACAHVAVPLAVVQVGLPLRYLYLVDFLDSAQYYYNTKILVLCLLRSCIYLIYFSCLKTEQTKTKK